MKKRLIALILAAVLCFGLTGCGFVDKSEENTTVSSDSSASLGGDYENGQDYNSQQSTDTVTYGTTTEITTSEVTTTAVTTTEVTTTQTPTTEAITTTEATTQSTTEPDNNQYTSSTPLLYKVTDSKGNYVWLFGSIHVGREDYYPLPDYVNRAYEESEALAVEMDVDAFSKNAIAQYISVRRFVYNDGTTIKDHIPEETYNRAVAILKENGLYSESLDYYKPVLWSNFVDSCALSKFGAKTDLGVDLHLINRAKESGKKILEVESAGKQYKMLAGFSDDLQLLMLASSVSSYGKPEKLEKDLNEMMDLWAEGDEAKFSEYLSKESEVEDERVAKLYEEYNKALIDDRNETMTKYVINTLKRGRKAFICVGAAHVVGEGAIADRLRDKGYRVEIIR